MGHICGAVVLPIPFILGKGGSGTGDIALMLRVSAADDAMYYISGGQRRVNVECVKLDPAAEDGLVLIEPPEGRHNATISKGRDRVDLEIEVTTLCRQPDKPPWDR